MENNFLTTDWLSMEALYLLVNQLEVSSHMYTGFNKEYQKPFAVGETIRVEYPVQYLIRDGIEYDPDGIDEIQTNITCNQVFGVDFEWDDVEQALELERDDTRLNNFYFKSPVAQIAQEWDLRSGRFAAIYSNLIAGTLGTDPTGLNDYSNLAEQKLYEMACPADGEKAAIISPSAMRALVNSSANYFQAADMIAKQYKKGLMYDQAGLKFYRSMSLYRHTAGTWQTPEAVTVNGGGQSGSSLNINCTPGDTFKKGDKIGIASVYNANPRTRQRTNTAYTFTFTVTADVTATGATATLPISPPIYGPGSPYQNVDALPGNTALLTLFPGTTSPNGKSGTIGVTIHPDAFAIVGVPLDLPKNEQIAKQQRDEDTGMSIRMVRSWDPVQSRYINRFDTLGGYGILYNGNCCVAMLGA